MLATIIITIIYLFILVFLGFWGYRQTKNSQDYLVGGRQIHPLVMALSYGSTFISTSAIIGFGGAAGQLGMGLLWLTFLNIFVGIFVAFIIFGKRTRKIGHNVDAHTFPELLGVRYQSKFLQGFAGFIIFLFMPIYAAAVIKGGVEFIQTYFGISYEVGLLFFVIIVAMYVWMGGMKAVMYTDAFQALIMFAGMAFLLIYAYAGLGGVIESHSKLTALVDNPSVKEQTAKLMAGGFQGWTSMPKGDSPIWWSLVSTIVMGVGIGVLAQPQLVVRFMTVRSNRELNRAVLSGGVFILMMTGVAFVVGALSNVYFFEKTGKIALAAAGGTDKIIPEFIKNQVPSWFGGVFLLVLLAAAMSTLSSQFHTMGTAVGRDIYEKSLNRKGNTILITRVGMLFTIVLSTMLAYLAVKLDMSMAIIATGTALFFGLCAASFLPAYIGALYFRTLPRAAAVSGMIAGFVMSSFWIFFIHAKESSSLQICNLLFGVPSLVKGTAFDKLSIVDPIFVALPVSICVTLVVWGVFALKKKTDVDQEHVSRCFNGIR